MKYLSTFGLYSLVLLAAYFSYMLGIVIRGILAEQNEDKFRKRIIDIHSAALMEVNHLRKDLRNEMEARKAVEKLASQRLKEIEALQANMPKAFTGGEATGLTGNLGYQQTEEINKDDKAA